MTNEELLAKIKAEIERLIEASDFDESANLYGLLSFLDTLEEPVSDCHDFDSLFDEFCDAHPDGMTLEECGRFFFSRGFSRGKMVATNDFDLTLAQRYLIGFNDGKRESVSDCHDLEEELENYYGSIPDDEDKINAARHFAKWQKAKMMEKEDEQ